MPTRRSSVTPPRFGLLAWLEEARIALPLKGVKCQFQVTGAVASVQLDQIYHQDAVQPLDCTYTFPLPAGAAVYRCELHVNGRVIRAKVEAKKNAQRIYRQQKAAGRRAALVETERENLFTLTLGNVQPGDLIVIRFAWFQVLDRAGNGLRLLIPTCPGIRYIPGQPLRGKGAKSIELIGRLPDGTKQRFSIALGTVGSEAIKLLWAKEKIATLLVAGDRQEAIALAKEHNLLCEGTAFIAWDQAEQVQVAEEEIVQPALDLHRVGATLPVKMACASAPAPTGRGTWCASRPSKQAGAGSCYRMEAPSAPLSFGEQAPEQTDAGMNIGLATAREIYQRLGMLGGALLAYLDSLSGRGAEGMYPVEDCRPSGNSWKAEGGRLNGSLGAVAGARPATGGGWSGQGLPALGNQEQGELPGVLAARDRLTLAGVSAEIIEYLLAWAVPAGAIDRDRVREIHPLPRLARDSSVWCRRRFQKLARIPGESAGR